MKTLKTIFKMLKFYWKKKNTMLTTLGKVMLYTLLSACVAFQLYTPYLIWKGLHLNGMCINLITIIAFGFYIIVEYLILNIIVNDLEITKEKL